MKSITKSPIRVWGGPCHEHYRYLWPSLSGKGIDQYGKCFHIYDNYGQHVLLVETERYCCLMDLLYSLVGTPWKQS